MREAKSFRSVEHQYEDMIAEQAVIERLVVAQSGEILVEGVAHTGSEFQFEPIVPMAERAFIVMALTAQLLPRAAIAEIDALVLWRVDVIRPKQANVTILERMLRGDEAKSHVDIMRGNQFEASPAFEEEGRSGRLMQLGRRLRELLEGRGSVAWLKENLPTIVVITFVAVENVLQIEARNARHEE